MPRDITQLADFPRLRAFAEAHPEVWNAVPDDNDFERSTRNTLLALSEALIGMEQRLQALEAGRQ